MGNIVSFKVDGTSRGWLNNGNCELCYCAIYIEITQGVTTGFWYEDVSVKTIKIGLLSPAFIKQYETLV